MTIDPIETPEHEQAACDEDDLRMWADTTPFRHARHDQGEALAAAEALETWAAKKGLV